MCTERHSELKVGISSGHFIRPVPLLGLNDPLLDPGLFTFLRNSNWSGTRYLDPELRVED